MNTRKILSAVCHGSVWLNPLLLSVGIPITMMLVSEDPVVKANAKEALNVHLNLFAAYILFTPMCWILIGFPLLAVAGLYNLIAPIFALCHLSSHPDEVYRYPCTVRLIDSSLPRQLSSATSESKVG